MDHIDLELIVEKHASYGTGETISLPIVVHVHKYLEQFIYTNSIKLGATPIAYLANPAPDSWKNLILVNKSHTVIANSPRLLPREKKLDSVVSTAYATNYSNILATDIVITDSNGKANPLFYRHELPSSCVEANIYSVKNGNKEFLAEGYLVDLDSNSLYTNYHNYFDPDSGSYRLFFVSATSSTGEVQNTLLNAAPAVKEASWEDIDLDTGDLTDAYPLYTKEKSSRGYSFYFNRGSKWFIKPQEIGLIQPRRPQNKRPNSPWYIRFTNGDVSDVVNNATHRYYIPEFSTQAFIPYNPIKYAPREDLLIVSKRVLAATRKTLNIDPTLGLHLEIIAEDEEGNLKNIYTTDQSLLNKRYSNTDLFYETDKIASWDNEFGFIALATDIFPNYTYFAKYYYKADDYEYTSVNLNPITNRKLKDHTYVFYCIPDTHIDDQAIHHLLVDSDGRIVETSQSLGLSHPNLQLKNTDGSYNANTVINTLYFSETENNFLSSYAAGFSNTNAYLILAEVSAIDTAILEDQISIDVRRPGYTIASDQYQEAILANPRILQSVLGYGEEGQIVPEVNVVVIEPPLSILEDYGGLLTTEQAEQALRTHMPVTGYAVIKWVYPKSVLTLSSTLETTVNISFTWEGVYNYLLWRRPSSSDAWELISEFTEPVFGDITYTDTNRQTGYIYQYAVSIAEVDSDVEYPMSDIISIKVR